MAIHHYLDMDGTQFLSRVASYIIYKTRKGKYKNSKSNEMGVSFFLVFSQLLGNHQPVPYQMFARSEGEKKNLNQLEPVQI